MYKRYQHVIISQSTRRNQSSSQNCCFRKMHLKLSFSLLLSSLLCGRATIDTEHLSHENVDEGDRCSHVSTLSRVTC